MKNKKVLILIIVVAVIIVSAIIGNLDTAEDNTANNVSETNSDLNTAYTWDPASASTDECTSARVDEIYKKAIDDVKRVSEDEIENVWEESFEYLKEHANNFYESNEIMEKSMYYGYFIYEYIEENSPAANISELPDSVRAAYEAGYNTVKAIKYVYRGVDQIEDESTQNALTDAQNALNAFQD